jgi:hypothetical protein
MLAVYHKIFHRTRILPAANSAEDIHFAKAPAEGSDATTIYRMSLLEKYF